MANANRRAWFVRIQKRFCRRVDMLAELSDCKRNRCAKPILRRRLPVLSSLAGKLWIPGERSEICPGSHGNPKKTQGCEGTVCPFPGFQAPLKNGTLFECATTFRETDSWNDSFCSLGTVRAQLPEFFPQPRAAHFPETRGSTTATVAAKTSLTARRGVVLTITNPKDAVLMSPIFFCHASPNGSSPRRIFHFSGPSGFPLVSHGCPGRFLDSRNLSGIARKPEENYGSRVDRLPVSQKSSFRAPPRDPSEKSTFMAGPRER